MFFNFIRGGQTLANRFRETIEALVRALIYAFVITLITIPVKFKINVDSIEVRNTFHYYIAKYNIIRNQPGRMVGTETKMRSIDILNSNKFITSREKILSSINGSFIFFSYGVSFILILVIFTIRGHRTNGERFLRGARIVSPRQLNRIIDKYNNRRIKNRKGNKPTIYYSIANITYPLGNENLHTLIAGASGSGKTVLIANLIEQVRRNGDRAIIYDSMGTFVSRFYNRERIDGILERMGDESRKKEILREKDIILNPLDQRSPYWSIFNEARDRIDFDNIASALIPEKASNIDTFWNEAARTMFSSIANRMKETGRISNGELTNVLLRNKLTEAAKLARGTEAQSIIDEGNPKTALSVMAMLATNLKSLTTLRDRDADMEEPFSIRRWIENQEQQGFLFISSRADRHETLKPLITTWLDIAINSLLSLEQTNLRKIWIIIDELPSLHYLPSLQTGLAEARQFGGCFVLSMQLMAQLESIYGLQRARATSGLCRNRIILNTPDQDTARWCSDNLGKEEIRKVQESQSFSSRKDSVNINAQELQRNIVLPTQLMQLDNLSAYVKFGGDFPVALSRFKYRNYPKVAESYREREFASLKENEDLDLLLDREDINLYD